MNNSEVAYLLINLGTPDSPSPADVKKYLAEFLMDPRVIDISKVARFALVHGIILNTRPKKSAQAYQQIWTERGSPLKFHTEDLVEKLSHKLPNVFYSMRYGKPSIEGVLKKLKNFSKIVVLPLYPQFAWSSTASCIEKTKDIARELGILDKIQFLPPFYKQLGYRESLRQRVKASLDIFKPDHVLVSYHGLPERQLAKGDPKFLISEKQHCLSANDCCETNHTIHNYCYRHQCFETTKALALDLKWAEGFYTNSFQSRLGRTPWIQPFTDFKIKDLAATGTIKRLAVICPSFVSDCLETLEEIGIRAKNEFEGLVPGGKLELVPCLNTQDYWVDALKNILLSDSPKDFGMAPFSG